MKIKTNLNRLHYYHDNVNYEPIEVQVVNYIKETKLFTKVEFKVSGKNLDLFLDGHKVEINIENYRTTLHFYGDYFDFSGKGDRFNGMIHSIEYKDNNPNQTQKFLELISKIIALNVEAKKIVNKIKIGKEYDALINEELNKYFNNDLVKATYNTFTSNIIPKDNEYTSKGNWSWLSFELNGIKQRGYNQNKFVTVKLYTDGKIKDIHMDEFVKAISCNEYDNTCNPSIKEMQSRLAHIGELEEKMDKFNGTKIPYLKEFLALQEEGYAFRKTIKL